MATTIPFSRSDTSVLKINAGFPVSKSKGDWPGAHPDATMICLHACALALSPDEKSLVVANAGSDTLSVIDTRTDKIVETICARQNEADSMGCFPDWR